MSEMTTEATEVHVKDLGADGYKLSVFLKEGHYSRKDLKILLEAMRRAKRQPRRAPECARNGASAFRRLSRASNRH